MNMKTSFEKHEMNWWLTRKLQIYQWLVEDNNKYLDDEVIEEFKEMFHDDK